MKLVVMSEVDAERYPQYYKAVVPWEVLDWFALDKVMAILGLVKKTTRNEMIKEVVK